MKRKLLLLSFVVFACSTGFSQVADNAPATKADVEKLFDTMHIREQMHNVMELASKQSRQMAQEALKKKLPQLSQKDLDRMNEFMDRTMKQMDFDGMIDDMVPVYQRHLSKGDVSAMQAFYETPTGQKLLREQPAMTAEAMQAMQPRMQKMMATMMDEAEKMGKEAASQPVSTEEK
jgi:hypothetical protein